MGLGGGGGVGSEGVAGIPWGLDIQSSHYPQEFDRQLWHISCGLKSVR